VVLITLLVVFIDPNQKIVEFTSALSMVISEVSNQKVKCIIAGDFNIDLTKCTVSNDTSTYVDNLVMNNFMPTVLMPTRITSLSATLIDHIYYYDGYSRSSATNVYSGNILCDFISDHLSSYTLIMSKHEMSKKSRPYVRIFFQKNMEIFNNYITEADWNAVCSSEDVNFA